MNEVFEIKANIAVDDAGAITGLAWPFGSPDRMGDEIQPGAFKSARAPLPMLWSHDPGEPVGVWDTIAETAKGLEVKGRLLVDDVAKAKEVRALVKSGAVRGLSIGFVSKSSASRKGGGRTIRSLDLMEISIVAIPANPGAKVTTMKAAGAAKGQKMDEHLDDGAVADNAEINLKLAELEAKAAKIDDLETKLDAAAKRADALELKIARPGIITGKDGAGELHKKAFSGFLRRGTESLSADEVKSLIISDSTRGGYLATPEFSAEIDRNIVLVSPIRQLARVGSTASGSVIIPKRTDALTASWVGEQSTRTEGQPLYGQTEIPAHEIGTYVDISTRMLEDAAVNLEAEIAFDLAEQFGAVEGAAFVNGTGVGQPTGFMIDSDVTAINSGAATAVTADSLISLFYGLASSYRQRASFVMNSTTMAAVRKLKDGNGQYLWAPGLAPGQPETLMGRPVVEAPDMPNVGAGAYPIAFGDFGTAYRIYDRVGTAILRDPYSVAVNGMVRFHARRRVGGGVVRAEAIKKLLISV